MMKKALSILLSLTVLLSVVMVAPFAAYAEITLDDSKVYIKSDGEYYEVEKGQVYTYTYSVMVEDSFVTGLDATTYYDADGLQFVPDTLSDNSDDLDTMFPNLSPVIYNYADSGMISYNYATSEGADFTEKDTVVFSGKFLVIADNGVYEIVTMLKTMTDYEMDVLAYNFEKLGEYEETQDMPEISPVQESTQPPTQPETEAPTQAPTMSANEIHVVAGVSALCGSNWDPSDTNNQMTYNSDKDVYEKIYENVAAGTYEFKVTTDYAWGKPEYNLEGLANNGGANASVTVPSDGITVIISFDGEKAYVELVEAVTEAPTAEPTEAPTVAPTAAPTAEPTEAPTVAPTAAPTAEPTEAPTVAPTAAPTAEPTEAPTAAPTVAPTVAPTAAPTVAPTQTPTTAEPGYYLVGEFNGVFLWYVDANSADRKLNVNPDNTDEYMLNWTFYQGDALKVVYYNGRSIEMWYKDQSDNFVIDDTNDGDGTIYFNPNGNLDWSYTYLTVIADEVDDPTVDITEEPTDEPTQTPTVEPTAAPTAEPTEAPTAAPTAAPTEAPTAAPTAEPTQESTQVATVAPTETPSVADDIYIEADGVRYKVEKGEIFTYIYCLSYDKKISSLDAEIIYDENGLEFIPTLDEYGDNAVKVMFPVAQSVVYNFDVAGRIAYNFSIPDGVRFPVQSDGSFTEKNRVFVGQFKVTGDNGVYEINTILETLGDVEKNILVYEYQTIPGVTFNTGTQVETTTEQTVMIGDVDGDGVVNVFDVTAIQRYIAKYITFDNRQMIAADADKDGVINIYDATHIQRYLAKYITEL